MTTHASGTTPHGRPAVRGIRLLRVGVLAILSMGAGCGEQKSPTENANPWLAWTAPLVEPTEGMPVASGDLVVIGGASALVGYAQSDGAVRWRIDARGAGSSRRLLERGGVVYAPGYGAVRAVEGTTGRILWTRELGTQASPDFADAEIDERALYVGTRDRRVLALDPASGNTVWETRIDDFNWGTGAVRGITRAGDTLYVAASRDLSENRMKVATVLVALDRRDGRELWRFQSADDRTAPGGAPLLAGRLLVTGGAAEGATIAVDRFTGEQVWARQLASYVWGTPLLDSGRVYMVTQAARAYALDPQTGTVVWDEGLGAGGRYVAPCAGRLVVPNHHIDVLSRETGKRLGRVLHASDAEYAATGVVVVGNRAFVPGYTKLFAVRCDA